MCTGTNITGMGTHGEKDVARVWEVEALGAVSQVQVEVFSLYRGMFKIHAKFLYTESTSIYGYFRVFCP